MRVPADRVGDVMSDLNGRRGHVHGVEPDGDYSTVEAEAPLAQLLGYSTWLGELTEEAQPHASAWLCRYLPVDDGGPYAA